MSNINPYSVDGTYPIAGQDNDSQGFRDNFTNIRTNLTFAQQELTDLQTKAVLKTALTGGSLDNTFNNVLFTGVQAKAFTETQYDFGTVSGAQSVQFTNGHLQTITTSGSVTLGFTGWPAAGYHGKIRLWVNFASVAHTLTLPASVTIGLPNIYGFSGLVLTVPATGVYIFEFSTYDGGVNVFIEEITGKLIGARILRAAPGTHTGAAGDVAGMIAFDATHIYVCSAAYDGITSIWLRGTLAAY